LEVSPKSAEKRRARSTSHNRNANSMNKRKSNKLMKCPDCGEIANFSHFYSMDYGAPAVLEGGEATIDYDNATDYEAAGDDEDTCRCGKCGSDVSIDEIEIVEAEEEEA